MSDAPGLLGSLKKAASTLLGMAQLRLELLANEWEEERLRLTRMLFYSLAAGFFFCLGMLLLTLLVIAIFWDTHRILVISLIAVAYLGIAAALFFVVRRQARQKPRLFSASVNELAKDRAVLEKRP